MKQRIIAFSNQKGGTAKTTTTANLGYALSRKKKRVLLIDLDAQGNLGLAFGLNSCDKPTIREVLLRQNTLEESVSQINPYLYISQANKSLSQTAIELVSIKAREMRLKAALKDAVGFDYILIDCPPNLDLLTVNALSAATEVIIPVEAEYFAASGVALIRDSINEIKQDINDSLEISGILITKTNTQQNLHKDIISAIRGEFDTLVFKSMIPKNISISEAQPHGKTVIEFAPKSKGTQAYLDFAKEVIKQEVK